MDTFLTIKTIKEGDRLQRAPEESSSMETWLCLRTTTNMPGVLAIHQSHPAARRSGIKVAISGLRRSGGTPPARVRLPAG